MLRTSRWAVDTLQPWCSCRLPAQRWLCSLQYASHAFSELARQQSFYSIQPRVWSPQHVAAFHAESKSVLGQRRDEWRQHYRVNHVNHGQLFMTIHKTFIAGNTLPSMILWKNSLKIIQSDNNTTIFVSSDVYTTRFTTAITTIITYLDVHLSVWC